MRIGAHVSAAGGLHTAPERAATLGLRTFQFFSRPPQGGRISPLTPETIDRFRGACREAGIESSYVHTPYVVNLASKERRIRDSSVEIIRGEIDRASQLGVTAVMTHIGSASSVGDEREGIRLAVEGLKRILDGYSGPARFCIEISSGAGMVIGDTFEEVAALTEGVGDDRMGVCFDTAHAFASGYDLRSGKAIEKTLSDFLHAVGPDRLAVIHCNDSKVGLGEKKDRHEHIGKGRIGIEGFRALVRSPHLRDIDLILETPPEGVIEDIAVMNGLMNERGA